MKVAKVLKTIADNEQGTDTLYETAKNVDVDSYFLLDDETKDSSVNVADDSAKCTEWSRFL